MTRCLSEPRAALLTVFGLLAVGGCARPTRDTPDAPAQAPSSVASAAPEVAEASSPAPGDASADVVPVSPDAGRTKHTACGPAGTRCRPGSPPCGGCPPNVMCHTLTCSGGVWREIEVFPAGR